MSSFKHRPPKLKYRTDAITLDEIHKKQMEMMDSNYKKLEYLSKTSDLLVGYYDKISKEHYNHDDNTDYNDADNNNLIIEIDKINNVNNVKIEKNKQDQEQNQDQDQDQDQENNQFILSNDLKLLNQMSKNLRKAKKPIKKRKKTNNNSKSIFHFFDEEIKETENTDIEEAELNASKEKNKINNFLTKLGKTELQDKFLFIMDKNYACTKVKLRKNIMCSLCGIEKTLFTTDGCYTCKKCGETEHIVMENENNSNKDMNFEKQKYPYKKINHLKEKLNQFQSKENADIPENLYNLIFDELKKQRINPLSASPYDIKTILKKNRQTNYYEHLQQICCKITGRPPITLPRDIEIKIISMFQSIQESFQKHKCDNRSNFLSYAYVLNKLFKILGYPFHSDFFCLLKSKEKLRDQDNTWAKICKDMNWKFYPSTTIAAFQNIYNDNDNDSDNDNDKDNVEETENISDDDDDAFCESD